MRVKTFFRMLRIIAAVTLFFFSWSFGPIYAAVAYAAAPEGKGAGSRSLQAAQGTGPRVQGPVTSGERFEKALEAIRENVGKAGDKLALSGAEGAGRGDAATGEIAAIKKQRAEIEKSDVDLKAEFAATEKKLKDAKLPKEILDRHAKFVKHYEDNLAELKVNLAGIEQGAGSKGFKEALSKAKAHLEKTKAPSKHVPLDPNKLPHRMVKAKERAPRLKKEEFEKDFPAKKKATKLARLEAISATDGHGWTRIKHKPIILADNSPASDVPFQLSRPSGDRVGSAPERFSRGVRSDFDQVSFAVNDFNPNSALADSTWGIPQSEISNPQLIVAQAVILPALEDLMETPEVQFTPEIQALAAQLNHNPVKIYEWVRNNIEFVPTYGSIQGAQMTMESKLGNAFDTASLLIALLRVSEISAHYVYGTIEIPIEKAMNWVGGVTDPKMVGTILATNGIPAKVLISGGTIKAVQLEHVTVSAFIDYIPSRGAVHKQGDTWVPLDPSFKQYTYSQGLDITSAVPFDAQSFTNQILSTATTNTTDGSVTNVNSALVQQTMQDYQTQVQNYIQQNYPNAAVGDVIGKKEIIQQNYPILLGTLPYKIVQVGSEFASVPDNLRETMSFSIPDFSGGSTGLSYITSLPQIAGKRITLSFSPATANDQTLIATLLPAPHADWTAIQLSELPPSFPAYLINLKPELRIDGQVVATGSSVMMGSAQSFAMSLNEPGIGPSNIDNIINAGEYFGIGVDIGRISANRLNTLKSKLEATKTKLETQAYDGLTKDDIVGDILYTTIASYFAELDAADEIATRTMNIIRYRAPSVGMFSLALNINETFGVPISAGPKGMMLDVDRIMQTVFSKDGSMDKVKQYMLSSGAMSSTLEHAVPEALFSTPTNPVQGISAVKAINAANEQGIPIYMVNQSNINTILPLLQLNPDVKTDIQNAVNAGKIVTVQKTNVTYNHWTGCGYIIIDPNTGAGSYMISDGLNGGGFEYWFWTVMLGLAYIALVMAIILILPEIIAALSAIGSALSATIGELAITVGETYLDASIATNGFIQSGIARSAIFSALMFYAQNSPPPWPIPTDPIGGVYFYLFFRAFLYFNIRDFIRSGYLIQYWRFATNTGTILSEKCDRYLKPIIYV